MSIRVEGFVRPLRVPNARAMVEEKGGGPLLEGDGGFWMNSIKSHAVATFADPAHATAAAAAIDGNVWPPETGKALAAVASDTSATEAAAGAVASRTAHLDARKEAETKAREALLAKMDARKLKRSAATAALEPQGQVTRHRQPTTDCRPPATDHRPSANHQQQPTTTNH